jgi:hypothetical protein
MLKNWLLPFMDFADYLFEDPDRDQSQGTRQPGNIDPVPLN